MLVFGITEDWPERTSWKGQPDNAPEPAAKFEFVAGEGWKLFDITPVVRSQAECGQGRHGVLLRWLSEDRPGPKGELVRLPARQSRGHGGMGTRPPEAPDHQADEEVTQPEDHR